MLSPQDAKKIKEVCENTVLSSNQKLQKLHEQQLLHTPDKFDVESKKLLLPVLQYQIEDKRVVFNYHKNQMIGGLLKLAAPVNTLIFMGSHLFGCEQFDLGFCNSYIFVPAYFILLCCSLCAAKNSVKEINDDIDKQEQLKKDIKTLETFKQLLEQQLAH
jgi:hypothetical protein